MQAKNYPVLMIGLLVLGFLIVPRTAPWEPAEAQAAGEPIIQFVAPAGTQRYVDDADPIDPAIDIDVEVDFPEAAAACSGAPLPVDHTTLQVRVNRQLDGAVLETWDDIDESSWLWNEQFNHVTGQVTIGGATSGQIRSLYGIEVCISNAAKSRCATKAIRVEHPVSDLEYNAYESKAISFSQSAGCGLIDPNLIPTLNTIMKNAVFYVYVPSAAEISGHTDDDVNFTNIPLLGIMNMTASLNGGTNNVDLAPVTVTGVDLGALPVPLPPSYNCEISGSGDGILYGPVSPGDDLDGEIRVFGITLATGSGSGACTRDATGCELLIKFDGNPLF